MKSKVLNYTIVFQKEPEGGYTTFVPFLPGCVSYGKNLEEAKKMIGEAIKLYLKSLESHKEEIVTEKEVFYTQVNIDTSSFKYTYA